MAQEEHSENANNPETKKVEIGDLIQWEAAGVLKLPAPRRVRDIKEHEGLMWVFIEESQTGIPMSEVIVVEKGAKSIIPPTLPITDPPASTSDISVFTKGEREWLRGPLSRDASYRLIVSGELGPKEIGKLIKLLEAQKAVLSDDDQDA